MKTNVLLLYMMRKRRGIYFLYLSKMDPEVEKNVASMMYTRLTDRPFFFHPKSDTIEFTRPSKNDHDIYPYQPFTDSGSRAQRTPFARPDYIIQNPINGATAVRGEVPRVRVPLHLR